MELPCPGPARRRRGCRPRPTRDDAGLDLRSVEASRSRPGDRGARSRSGSPSSSRRATPGWCCRARGLAARHGITLLNAPGLIDAGYRGELQVVLHNTDAASRSRSRSATASPSWWSSPCPACEPVRGGRAAAQRSAARAASARRARLSRERRAPHPRRGAAHARRARAAGPPARSAAAPTGCCPGGGVEAGETLDAGARAASCRRSATSSEVSPRRADRDRRVDRAGASAAAQAHRPRDVRRASSPGAPARWSPRATRPSATSACSGATSSAQIDLRPPIQRFVERWRPGDPFVALGRAWVSDLGPRQPARCRSRT